MLLCIGGVTLAQSPGRTWTHKYDLGVFGEYSPTSSHIQHFWKVTYSFGRNHLLP